MILRGFRPRIVQSPFKAKAIELDEDARFHKKPHTPRVAIFAITNFTWPGGPHGVDDSTTDFNAILRGQSQTRCRRPTPNWRLPVSMVVNGVVIHPGSLLGPLSIRLSSTSLTRQTSFGQNRRLSRDRNNHSHCHAKKTHTFQQTSCVGLLAQLMRLAVVE